MNEATSTLCDAKEIARLLDVQVCTIRKMTLQKRIPFLKIGRAVRFEPRAVFEFFKDKTDSESSSDEKHAA